MCLGRLAPGIFGRRASDLLSSTFRMGLFNKLPNDIGPGRKAYPNPSQIVDHIEQVLRDNDLQPEFLGLGLFHGRILHTIRPLGNKRHLTMMTIMFILPPWIAHHSRAHNSARSVKWHA